MIVLDPRGVTKMSHPAVLIKEFFGLVPYPSPSPLRGAIIGHARSYNWSHDLINQ